MEFLSLLCHLFIIGITVVLPLYTGGTYLKLGDTKYTLFRNIALFCIGAWLVVSFCNIVRKRLERVLHGAEGVTVKSMADATDGSGRAKKSLSVMDAWMLCYGVAVTLSFAVSRYKSTAWFGYNEWYMGAMTQLLLVGIYFFVSRCHDGKNYSLLLGEAALFLVLALALCHRLGIDMTGLMEKFDMKSWEYSHMLSTIGNINWFCGYCSVALAFPIAEYLKSERRLRCSAAYIVSVMGLMLLMIQGSDIGIILVAVSFVVCLILGINDGKLLKRTMVLWTGVCFLLQFYGLLVRALGDSAVEALPADGFCRRLAGWQGWWLPGLAGIGLCVGLDRLMRRRDRQRMIKGIALGMLALAALGGLSGVLFFSFRGSFEGGWGNGRGALWRLSLQVFLQSGVVQKLFGAGPDCFAEYIYSVFLPEALPELGGRWAGTIFANAHNEWLNHLVNLGLVGTGCYMGIFVSGILRYRRYLPGLLALVLYGVVSLTGFQQVLSTPFLFFALGMAESKSRGSVHDV